MEEIMLITGASSGIGKETVDIYPEYSNDLILEARINKKSINLKVD